MFWTIRGVGVMMLYWVFWHLAIQNDHNKNSPPKPTWILDELYLRFFDIAIAVALSLEHQVLSHTLNKPAHFIMQWIVCILTPYFTLKACVNLKSYLVMLQPHLLLSLTPCILRLHSHRSLYNHMFSGTVCWVCCILFELQNVRGTVLAKKKKHWFCFQCSKESLQREKDGCAEQPVLFMYKSTPSSVWMRCR